MRWKMLKKLLLAITILLFLGLGYTAENPQISKRLITVSASDYVEALPDTAYFNFNFSIDKDSPEEATKLGEQIKKNIKLVLQEQQLPKADILLDATSLSERYDYENKKTIHSYNYSGRLRITDFNKLASLRQALFNEKTFSPAKEDWFTKRGLTVNQDISYEIVAARAELEKTALKKAYEKALLKVKGLSEISNFKYSIYRVTESGSESLPQPVYRYAAKAMLAEAAGADNSASTETLPTLQRINSAVTVEAEIL